MAAAHGRPPDRSGRPSSRPRRDRRAARPTGLQAAADDEGHRAGRPASRAARSRGSSAMRRWPCRSRPRPASGCWPPRASWASGPIHSHGPCAGRRRCSSARSSATSPTRSSRARSRRSRSRPARWATTSCSATPTPKRPRPMPWRRSSRRASATRSCSSGDMGDQPRLLEDLRDTHVPVVALWQGSELDLTPAVNVDNRSGIDDGDRAPARPRPSPDRVHRRSAPRGHPRTPGRLRASRWPTCSARLPTGYVQHVANTPAGGEAAFAR